MGERTPQTVLERVARLESENADLAARIARIRTRSANADTVSTRRPGPRAPAAVFALAFAFAGTLAGFAVGWTCRTSTPATPAGPVSDPPPAIDPLPPTPPVYAVPPPRVGGLRSAVAR